jgi:hypothetical protein
MDTDKSTDGVLVDADTCAAAQGSLPQSCGPVTVSRNRRRDSWLACEVLGRLFLGRNYGSARAFNKGSVLRRPG